MAEQNDIKRQLKLYEELVSFAVDAIVTGDKMGTLTSANTGAAELTGYSVEELIGINISELFSAEELQRAPLRYDLVQQGKVVVAERIITRKDGSTIPVEMKSRMLPDGSYYAFVSDLSERRAAEEALRLSEEKFSRAFRLSPDAINITRLRDAIFLDVNEGFIRLIGWTKEEVIGRSALPGDLNIWCDEGERQKLTESLLASGEALAHRVHLRHKDGFIGVGLMSAKVIEIEGEACIIAITRDITEQEALRLEREKLETQMLQAQKLESLGVLAGGIAHDFNNILMSVLGHCELAERQLPSEDPVRKNLEQIKYGVNKAADLADQMLAYSGKGQFIIEPCDLSRMVEEMRQMLQVSISKKAELVFDLGDALPMVEGDPTQLQQIVLNLAMNASDALEGRSGHVRIATRLCDVSAGELFLAGADEALPAGKYLDIEVTDDGCGMDEETCQRIFDPFFTTRFAGRGLGMAAVLGIVRGHRGSLLVDSTPGQGTRINVLLPATDKTASLPAEKGTDTLLKFSGLVLLVDDDPAVLEIAERMLAELGFSVVTAVDGEQSLAVYQQLQTPPRFVLLDLTMPRMGGEETFRELRRLSPNLPIILSSGFNEQEISAGFMAHQPVAFLKKPYRFDALQDAARSVLER